MTASAIIIGAPRSGAGKTSITIGLLRALARRGLKVRGVKSGPDYIDPGFHAAATGHPGLNLDTWAMQPQLLETLLADAGGCADILVIESAMGLFDGIPSENGRSGSAAELARRYGIPVLLVLDASGQSQTAAAVACGFAVFDSAVRMAGVVLNKLGSDRHRTLAGDAIETIGLPILGAVMRDSALVLPERHLGLVQANEHADLDKHIDRLADAMERQLNLDAIISLATPLSALAGSAIAIPPPGQRIALASDAAFSFLYPHLASQWHAAGAEITPFSPLANEAPDLSCNVCWLPGGYPELHAGQIAAADNFRTGVKAFSVSKPVHGECGGFMVLGQTLEDANGENHQMLGLLGHSTSFANRKMNLGYRRIVTLDDSPLGPAGMRLRGHEFHYARTIDPGNDEPFARIADGQGKDLGPCGGRRGNVSGSFFHAIAVEVT